MPKAKIGDVLVGDKKGEKGTAVVLETDVDEEIIYTTEGVFEYNEKEDTYENIKIRLLKDLKNNKE